MTPDEHAALLRELLEQHQTMLEDNRKAIAEGREADVAREAKGELRMAENRRSMFAATVLQGFVRFLTPDEVKAMGEGIKGGRVLARAAVVQADALLAELGLPSGVARPE